MWGSGGQGSIADVGGEANGTPRLRAGQWIVMSAIYVMSRQQLPGFTIVTTRAGKGSNAEIEGYEEMEFEKDQLLVL